ncbi:Di-and tricarboxylate transporter [Paracoccus aminovorans]|uniref:Di-and tricarboxylate transporter n=1 Tax=Paracoccus aminovorans TaxID=34004 RepID=A0A1I2XEL2_9RHOB|nr:SLC13 family permease [Paracoccus aminovorans]CQR85673.1 dATP pyrophosphohydrolase [Paracoccus aminovorans]SFH11459.1 Di-and tricarboxylate transporter [Paracoccus aminovorans]
MLGFQLTGTNAAIAMLVIITIMFIEFIREKNPPEVVAIGTAAVMMVMGLLPIKDAAGVLSNAAPWTIAFMFIIMGGLLRTGALEMVTAVVTRRAADRPILTICMTFAFIIVASTVMNNTPVVAVMIPILIQLGLKANVAPSKLLIPLSYMTILSGMITLIGTSTNLLVDGVAREQGMKPFTIFEIAPVGIAVTIAGIAYFATVGWRLLPDRTTLAGFFGARREMKYFTEVAVPEDSSLVGQNVNEVPLFKRDAVRVIDVLRGDASLRRNLAEAVLEPGDRVVLRSEMAELLEMQENKNFQMVDKLSSVATETVEVLISPGARLIGRRLSDMRLRRRYGVYVLAAHRRSQNIGRQLDDLVVQVGDTLLLEGAPEDIARLAADMELVDVSRPSARPFRRKKAPIAILCLLSVVSLAALEVAPIMALSFIAAAVVLITRCVDAEEAFEFVDARLMAMIFAMLAVGEALEYTGTVTLVVDFVAPWLRGLPPFATLIAVYFLGLVMTEVLSNNAVAVLLTPVAIALAKSLGHDPRAYVVAVMFSATVAFATPIGYQTHLMVYGPGGYKFSDFVKVGIPLDIICGIVACLTIPLFWPL